MRQMDPIGPEMAGVVFVKSSRSVRNGSCVEVGIGNDHVYVRDSKLEASPTLTFSTRVWAEFLAEVRILY